MSRLLRWVVAAQGLIYLAGGAWPLVSMRSFEWVTGPKVDDWLVRTVGLLMLVIGTALLLAARRRLGGALVGVLGIGTAVAFAIIDVVYATADRISDVYLLDAGLEIALALLVALGLWRSR